MKEKYKSEIREIIRQKLDKLDSWFSFFLHLENEVNNKDNLRKYKITEFDVNLLVGYDYYTNNLLEFKRLDQELFNDGNNLDEN